MLINKISLLNYLIDLNISSGLTFNLSFKDIGFYTYNYDINYQVLFENTKYKRLFIDFKKHPLIFWELKVLFGNNIIIFDFITNTATINKFDAITLNSVNFVNSPSLILKQNMFSLDFTRNFINQDFLITRSQIEVYNGLLLQDLYRNKFNKGVFLQEFCNNALQNTNYIRKVILFNKFI